MTNDSPRKSYLAPKTGRDKSKRNHRTADVKESLSKFLDEAQDEDLIFNACASPGKHKKGLSSTIHTPTKDRRKQSGLSYASDHISKSVDVSPLNNKLIQSNDNSLRDMPFVKTTRKSPSAMKQKLKRTKSKKESKRRVEEEEEDDDDDDDMESFAADDDDGDFSISSIEEDESERKSTRSNHQTHSSRTSRSSYGPPQRTKSLTSAQSSSSRSRPAPPQRSQSVRITPQRTQSMGGVRRTSSRGNLVSGLGSIDRQARRERMKRDYRSGGGRSDDDDGSVASARSTGTARSRGRYSGLEGGAFNAILGDENMARNASRGRGFSGGSVASTPADDKFLQDRKERLDLIMGVAMKEKEQYQARAAQEEQQVMVGDGSDYSSDEDGLKFGKKKGVMGNLRRAVRKSAKLTRSGAKGTVNVVKDPKRAAKNVGGFAKNVGKETTKMVLDPTLAAKRTAKGMKKTAQLTTKVTGSMAKGSYGMTKSIAKNGIKGTTNFVGTTLDGAGKVVHGATGLIFKKDGEEGGIVYAAYDPSALQHRQRRNTLIDRFADDNNKQQKFEEEIGKLQDAGISMQRAPDILAPSLNVGGRGSWDV